MPKRGKGNKINEKNQELLTCICVGYKCVYINSYIKLSPITLHLSSSMPLHNYFHGFVAIFKDGGSFVGIICSSKELKPLKKTGSFNVYPF